MADVIRQLLDQFGEPIEGWRIARMREETAPVGAVHARPPFAEHLGFGIDPKRLGIILRAADTGNTREWMILAEEIEELFPHYYAVLSKRRRQVSQLQITVEAAEGDDAFEEHADFVRRWLNTDALQLALFDVLDAVGKGYSVHEIIWETEPGCFRPRELIYKPQRFFELSWKDGATLWLRTEQGFADLVPHKFLVHTHRSKSGLVARGGLTRAVAFLWLYASYTARDWQLFIQGYGLPIRLGRYGPEASESDKRVLWRAVSSIAGDVAAIIPKSMEVEFIKDSDRSAGKELYANRADWVNFETSKLVLGSTAGVDAVHGSHAVGQEHRAAEDDVEKFDAALLSVSITRQLVQRMVAFTFGPQVAYPIVRVGRADSVPLKDVIAGLADLGPLGLKVKADEVRDLLHFSKPEDGDETIGGIPEPVDKPDIPSLAVTPPEANSMMGRILALQSETPPEIVESLTERLAADAAGAIAGMTERVRREFMAATDLHDLARRVHALKLAPKEFAEAMARGMALAQMVGQADLVDELRGRNA